MNISTAIRISRVATWTTTPLFRESAEESSGSHQEKRSDSQTDLIWPTSWLQTQHVEEIKGEVTDTSPQVDEDILQSMRQLEYPPKLVADIGWSQVEAFETRARLAAFKEDWDAPGMEGYDEL